MKSSLVWQKCQQVLTLGTTKDFRSPPVRQIQSLSSESSSKCSTYADKALIRKIFTPFKHDAIVRPIAAKLLSGKHIDKPQSTFSWGCESQGAAILWLNPHFQLSSLLTEAHDNLLGDGSAGRRDGGPSPLPQLA